MSKDWALPILALGLLAAAGLSVLLSVPVLALIRRAVPQEQTRLIAGLAMIGCAVALSAIVRKLP